MEKDKRVMLTSDLQAGQLCEVKDYSANGFAKRVVRLSPGEPMVYLGSLLREDFVGSYCELYFLSKDKHQIFTFEALSVVPWFIKIIKTKSLKCKDENTAL